jgi:DNA mismatch repair protein MutH
MAVRLVPQDRFKVIPPQPRDQSLPFPAPITAPADPEAALERARRLAGRTVAELAAAMGRPVPHLPRQGKGFVGGLVEWHLGVTAGSEAAPDFPTLGIEVKTIPLAASGQPKESTYITVVPLTGLIGLTWAGSVLRAKLLHILWIPYDGERGHPLAERRIGSPRLWRPTAAEEAALRADFEDLMELVALGGLTELSAEMGTHLQIRPKAASSRALTAGHGAAGQAIRTLPRGFYLRPSFTARIFRPMPGSGL